MGKLTEYSETIGPYLVRYERLRRGWRASIRGVVQGGFFVKSFDSLAEARCQVWKLYGHSMRADH